VSVNSAQRFTAGRPCPVCSGYEGAERGNGSRCYGFFSDDGKYAHCAREEYSGDIERTESSSTYAHYLGGSGARCKCGETHNTVEVSFATTNGKVSEAEEKKPANFDLTRDTVFWYREPSGEAVFASVRYGGKKPAFPAYKYPDGKWHHNKPDGFVELPYRLPELIKGIVEGKPVDIFEGESDVEAARQLGLLATCNSLGAGSWQDSITHWFRGANVRINQDNDADGKKHAPQVASKLFGVAKSIKMVPVSPGVGDGGDFKDWLEAGGTLEEYLGIVEDAPEFTADDVSDEDKWTSPLHSPYIPHEVVKSISRPPLVVKRFKDIPYPGPRTDIVEALVPEKEPTTFHGYGGTTKSHLGLDLLLCISAGETGWLGHRILNPKTALYVDLELSEAEQVRRAYKVAAGRGYKELPENFLHLAARGYSPKEVFTAVYRDCETRGTEVVLVDSVGLALIGDAGNYKDVIAFHRECLDLLIGGLDITPILIDHQANVQSGENYQSKSAFGSSYKHHLVRSRVQVELKESGNHHRAVILRQMKNNLGAEVEPVKALLEFEEDKVTIIRRALEQGEALAETTISIKKRIMMALSDGPKWPRELAEELGVSAGTISNATRDLRDENLVQRTGKKEHNSYEIELTDEGKNHYEMFLIELHHFTILYRDDEVVKSKKSDDEDPDPEPPDPSDVPKPKKKKTKKHLTLLDLARADKELGNLEDYNLIYREKQVPAVLEWLSSATTVGLDIETYGVAKSKGERSKLALSFVHGKIRLLQLSDGDTTYIIDTGLLRPPAVATILEALRSKTLIMHGGIFDLPRLKRHYGIDLMDEDIVDTMVLSRLARPGELKDDGKPTEHSLGAVLKTERVAKIFKDTDHEWHEPLNEDRLNYAIDDVRYLPALRDTLMRVVEERNQLPGLKLFMPAYREYMQMQYRGVPLDLERFNALLEKYRTRAENALSRVEELKPEHPEAELGEKWKWGNKLAPDAVDRFGNNTGRNGARRALELVGTNIKSLKKENRTEYLRKHPEAELLAALDEYYRYSDLHSDAKGWLTYAVEDGRLYPNINPFSQVTCRSAYSDPALQNTPKNLTKRVLCLCVTASALPMVTRS